MAQHADALAEALDVLTGRAASPTAAAGHAEEDDRSGGAAGALFSGNLVEDLMRPWRSAALSFEAAAFEWALVGPPGPSTTHSLRCLYSSLALRPALLRLALERRDAASSSAERVREAHANVRRGLSNLLEGALEPDPPSLAHLARASDGLLSSSFTLEEVAVVALLGLPPRGLRETIALLDLIGMAAVAKALLSGCAADASDTHHASVPAAHSGGGGGGGGGGSGDMVAQPVAPGEIDAAVALRARLAAAAGLGDVFQPRAGRRGARARCRVGGPPLPARRRAPP